MIDIVERLRATDDYEEIFDHLNRPYGLIKSMPHIAADEIEKLRRLVSYLAGTNTDHVRVALAGNPIICDAIVAEARAALGEKEKE